MQKLKILICSEAHYINSGYANYTKELLERLYNSGKYEIAEFASYAFVGDERKKNIPWKFYANAVGPQDQRYEEYKRNTENQFGKWRFEKVLLDFRPDVVIDVRDYWMHHYQSISPLRKFFHWIVMPTVDSQPQQESWIETYINADAVFTYSDWGGEVLKRQSNNKIKYLGTASPGIDLSVFKPYDIEKIKQIKKELNIEDMYIIGSVMRNQKRKLIPELMRVFKDLLNKLHYENHVNKDSTYLWLHTSYPDAGWDIPLLLKETDIYDKVIFTYFCRSCGDMTVSRFVGPKKICKKCGFNDCSMPSVISAPSRQQMCDMYNCFDIYVQYAICEGFGMPQIEASACGNPILTIDYSAMVDIVKKLKAYSVPVRQYFKEMETKAIRVYPDNEKALEIIFNHINSTDQQIVQIKKQSRELTEKHYDWNNIYQIWENYLDKLVPGQCSERNWSDPAIYLQSIPDNIINQNIKPEEHIHILTEICDSHLKDIKFLFSMQMLDLLFYADNGFVQNGTEIERYGINNILNIIQSRITSNNIVEEARVSNKKIEEDFILQA